MKPGRFFGWAFLLAWGWWRSRCAAAIAVERSYLTSEFASSYFTSEFSHAKDLTKKSITFSN
jgi:hypothetical protein